MEKKKVRSLLPDGRVALWERHPAHPHGEIFIASAKPEFVAMTSKVQQRIGAGYLEVVDDKPEESKEAEGADDKPKGRSKKAAE